MEFTDHHAAVKTASFIFNGVTDTLKKTMAETKIGQIVPHLDTPPYQAGLKFTKPLAQYVLLRSERAPFPKLSQIESRSDLYAAYQDSFPQRLDVVCWLMGILPLISYKMIQRDFVLYVYVGPLKRWCARASPLPRRLLRIVASSSRSCCGAIILLFEGNNAFPNACARLREWDAALREWGEYVPSKDDDNSSNSDVVVFDNSNTNPPWYNTSTNTNANLPDHTIPWYKISPSDLLGRIRSNYLISGDNYSPTKESSKQVGFGKESLNFINTPLGRREAPHEIYNPNFPSSSSSSSPGVAHDSHGKVAHDSHGNSCYLEIPVTKSQLRRALQLVSLAYAVPALVFPGQFLFATHLMLARWHGPLAAGKKIYHPLEELITYLPSLAPQKKEDRTGALTFGNSWLTLSTMVLGCGLLGVVFGNFSKRGN